MRQKNQNRKRMDVPVKHKRERGQAFVETALILLVFLASLIGAMDFGQLLFTHQLMVERVRSGVRWGVVNAWDGTGDKVANMVLYNSSTIPAGATPFLGMTRANVSVVHTDANVADPNDERMTVSIVDYNFNFFSPWIAHTYSGNYVAVESAPMQYKP
jgi:Flp pilus assembly protein TadG